MRKPKIVGRTLTPAELEEWERMTRAGPKRLTESELFERLERARHDQAVQAKCCAEPKFSILEPPREALEAEIADLKAERDRLKRIRGDMLIMAAMSGLGISAFLILIVQVLHG